MNSDKNNEEIELLKNNPKLLIITYQELISVIIKQFIKGGYFQKDEYDDIKQIISLRLIEKAEKINQLYDGRSLLRTYIGKIITNICREILREKRRDLIDPKIMELKNKDFQLNAFDKLAISDEFRKLKKIFTIFGKERYKLEICLKSFFRIPLTEDDFVSFKISSNNFKVLINHINECKTNKELNFILAEVINNYENKSNSPDAVRIYIDQKIKYLIQVLNGNPPSAGYTEETLKILLEMYYHITEQDF